MAVNCKTGYASKKTEKRYLILDSHQILLSKNFGLMHYQIFYQ